ncbi:hypothetical protein CHCC20488_0750 [Bacillus paralicheniformis]|uniref:Uncharacterized protein n=1 Tax=Bacillus paralicheniformis TaxID=1648923 RepID=A0A7Z0WV70_9BACI|nr:hypothetical protein B4121_3236 [Bacillus paralicheniformis]TWJ58558.1 hypothetical protein CHCC5022_3413 [Bacillus paralicheniformis]TWJ60749.1 hypothetical protein CHCC5023_0866 [Bacillus paralicheniformis]TWJ76060.1 hypothetical protein CHCC4186_1234 [Bacillus paralicheniformis]TWJ78009.1 hypothetical protein CHCC5019_1130 [Bacillus paralicheniformis]
MKTADRQATSSVKQWNPRLRRPISRSKKKLEFSSHKLGMRYQKR